jgi:hypothetical protein
MKGDDVDVSNLVIVDATLWIRKVRINPSILIAHAKSLNVHTVKYPCKRGKMHILFQQVLNTILLTTCFSDVSE